MELWTPHATPPHLQHKVLGFMRHKPKEAHHDGPWDGRLRDRNPPMVEEAQVGEWHPTIKPTGQEEGRRAGQTDPDRQVCPQPADAADCTWHKECAEEHQEKGCGSEGHPVSSQVLPQQR